jgi:hypothetical protein
MGTVASSICVSNTTSEAPDLSEQGAVQLPDGLGARLSSLSIDVSITQKSSDDSNYNVDDDQQTCITTSNCDDDNDPRSYVDDNSLQSSSCDITVNYNIGSESVKYLPSKKQSIARSIRKTSSSVLRSLGMKKQVKSATINSNSQ